MPTAQMLWAGKRLSPDEEEHTRDVVAMLERTGNTDSPRSSPGSCPSTTRRGPRTSSELAAGVGPWIAFGADVGETPAPAGVD